jgi:hypothetical protein
MPTSKASKGRKGDVLAFAVFEFAAAEDAEPITEQTAGRCWMERRRIDPLQHCLDVIQSVREHHAAVPVGRGYDHRQVPGSHHGIGAELGGLKKNHAN